MLETVAVLCSISPELEKVLALNFDLHYMHFLPDPAAVKVAVTTSMGGMNAEAMDALPALQLVCCNGAGLDRIDLDKARERGIEVFNTSEAVTTDTADFAIALIYATGRKVISGDRFVREGHWRLQKYVPSRRVTGSNIGIVGLGRIGHAVGQRALALNMAVAYHARHKKADCDFRYFDSVTGLAQWCDFLVLCCPETPQTRGIVNADVLKALGPHGILINIARGGVVDEGALLVALSENAIAGAGLDVFADEPNINKAFASLDNVVLSPHAAAVTKETREDMAHLVLARIQSFFEIKDQA